MFIPGHPGEHVRNAVVYLETEAGNLPVAFQKTGKSGGITFAHLDKGVYKLVMVLPQQAGKYARDYNEVQADIQVAYHSDKKIYFFQEAEGYFTIRFSGIKNLTDSNVTPMYEIQEKANNRIITGKFEVDGKYGSVTMKISALKQKSFQKLVNKYKHDAEMAVIKGQQLS